MKRDRFIKIFGSLVIFMAFLACSTQSYAKSTVTYHLEREGSLINVDDAAGRWQHEGGMVHFNNNLVGHYAAHRRVTFSGTDSQNTAMLTMTIFFLDENPPQNITLQGSHDFSSGKYIGSVSAASEKVKKYIKSKYTFSGNVSTGELTLSK